MHTRLGFVWFQQGVVRNQDRISLCNGPGCPGTHCVDQAGIELTGVPPESASQVLGLKLCATTPGFDFFFFFFFFFDQ